MLHPNYDRPYTHKNRTTSYLLNFRITYLPFTFRSFPKLSLICCRKVTAVVVSYNDAVSSIVTNFRNMQICRVVKTTRSAYAIIDLWPARTYAQLEKFSPDSCHKIKYAFPHGKLYIVVLTRIYFGSLINECLFKHISFTWIVY